MDDLESWLIESYPLAYRTAVLIMRDRSAAEDAVQEAYLRIWRFRTAIPEGDGRKPWLYRVVTNACLSQLRSTKPQRARQYDDGDAALAGVVGTEAPDRDAEQAVLADTVAAALAALPETLRVPLVLRYWTGLTEREIATAIKRRPGTVKSRLYDARQRLALDPTLAAWVTGTAAFEEVQ
jgi:RNA polymerase sigma-70 factor (ECF subfamily)